MMPFEIMRYRQAMAAGGATLYSETMARGPVNYWRNGEASGGALGMIDEVQAPAQYGSYVGVLSFSNPALYPGAGAGTSITGFSGVKHGTSSAFPAALTSMTLMSVVKFNSIGGFQPIGAQRDDNSSRKYFLIANGADIWFARITGSIGVYSVPGIASTTAAIYHCTVDASGNVIIYKNGVAQAGSWISGSAAAADYGGAGDQYQIGWCTGAAATLNGFTCENAVFDYVLTPADVSAIASASGL